MRAVALFSLAFLTGCGGGSDIAKTCELYLECSGDTTMTQDECETSFESEPEPTVCVQEFNDLSSCIADLANCTEYDAYWAGVPGDTGYPCAAEDDAFYSCGGA